MSGTELARIADALETIIGMVRADRAKEAAEEASRQAEKDACPNYSHRCRYCDGHHRLAGSGLTP